MGKKRRAPRPGTVVEIPLPDGSYCYACQIEEPYFQVYRFRAAIPLRSPSVFALKEWLFPVLYADLPECIVDTCKLPLSKEELQVPLMYEVLPDWINLPGGRFRAWDPVISNFRFLTEAETVGLPKQEWLVGEKLPAHLLERSAEFEFWDADRVRALLAENGDEVKPKPPKLRAEPQPVELTIVIPMAELPSDDPELEIEEPLIEALEEAEAGEVTGDGTMPDDTFNIDVQTLRPCLKTTLRVIRKVLTKLNCPASTVIEEAGDPPIRHPLQAEPKSK